MGLQTQRESNNISLPVGAALLEKYRRVKYEAAGLALAGAGETAIGQTQDVGPIGGMSTVRHVDAPGTHVGVAGGAITVGAALESLADGKIGAGATNPIGAIAITAAGADGDFFEFAYVK